MLLTTQAVPDQAVPLTTAAVGLVAGNFDDNPTADILTVTADGQVTALLNGTNDRWDQFVSSDLGIQSVRGYAGGRLNSDPLTDLVLIADSELVTATTAADGRLTLQQTISGFTDEFNSSTAEIIVGQLSLLNADTLADLVVPSPGRNEVLVLAGQGQGRFGTAARYATSASEPLVVATGHTIGTPAADLVVGHADGSVVFLEGNATGSFVLRPELTVTGAGPVTDLQLADLNNDGENDLVVVSPQDVRILYNTPDARSQPVIVNGRFQQGLSGWTQQVTGHSDPLSAGSVSVTGQQAVLRARGSFLTSLQQTFDIPDDAELLTLDLLQAGLESTPTGIPDAFEVSLLDSEFNSLVETHQPQASSFFNLQPDGSALLAAGVTFDGQTISLDLSNVAGSSGATLYLDLLGNSAGRQSTVIVDNVVVTPELVFTDTWTVAAVPGSFQHATHSAIADVDGDGVADIIISDRDAGLVAVFHADGSGGWNREGIGLTGFGSQPGPLATAELTAGDAVADLVIGLADPATLVSPLSGDISGPTVTLQHPVADITTTDSVASLQLQYSETVTDSGPSGSSSVTNPDSYRLVHAGPNGIIESGAGDDELLVIESVSWDVATLTATVVPESAAVPLPDGRYEFTVLADDGTTGIRDLLNNPLNDGANQVLSFTVNRLGPLLDPVPELAASEGTDVDLEIVFSDPGGSGNYTAAVDWGDGNVTSELVTVSQGRGTTTVQHRYANQGSYPVRVTVTDQQGVSGSQLTRVIVTNSPPVVATAAQIQASEGQTADYSTSFTDAGLNDQHTAVIDWGDGTSTAGTVTFANGTGTVTGSHRYADNGSFVVTTTVTDDSGQAAESSSSATITNTAATVTLTEIPTSAAGEPLTVIADFTDAGQGDTHTASIDWGDGSAPEAAPVEVISGNPGEGTAGRVTGTHTYLNPGTYEIVVSVTDDDNAVSTSSSQVTIEAPATPPAAHGPATVSEAAIYTLDLDPGQTAVQQWTVDWGDNSAVEQLAGSATTATHVFVDGFQSHTITATASSDHDSWTTNVAVDVINVAPSLVISGSGSVAAAAEFQLTLSATDPGQDTISHWLIDWGDGTSPQLVAGDSTVVTHVFQQASAGYTIQARAWDDDRQKPADDQPQTGGYLSNPLTVTVTEPESCWLPTIDFEVDANSVPLQAGDILTDQFADWGVHISTDDPVNHPPMIFNSAAPSGGDYDLGTPHASFGGPGRGHGGAAGADGQNHQALRNVLIISEDARATDPDDRAAGGTLIFRFDQPVMLAELQLLDIDEAGTQVQLFDRHNNLLKTIAVPDLGNNSVQSVALNAIGVTRLQVRMSGSGAIGELVFCRDPQPSTVRVSGVTNLNEGGQYQLFLHSGDTAPDSWLVDWGDGSPSETVSGQTTSLQHQYLDDGSMTITATARRQGQQWHASPLTVDVRNVPPQVTVDGLTTIGHDLPLLLQLSATDPGTDSIQSWQIDWGDGQTQSVPGHLNSVQHRFAEPGHYTIVVTVTDEDGDFFGGRLDVEVLPADSGNTRFFVVDPQDDRFYRYSADGQANGTFRLNPSRNVRGVTTTAAGSPLWTVDQNCNVYLYDSQRESFLGSWHAYGLQQPQGIATDGTDIWIVDRGRDRVFRYAGGAAWTSAAHSPTQSFRLHRGNRQASGITTNGSVLWVTDKTANRVFVYSVGGRCLGSWRLDRRNQMPTGITLDPNGGADLWVVDRQDDAVYHYTNALYRRRGQQAASDVFELDRRNSKPEGIADPTFPYVLNTVQTGTIDVVGEVDQYHFAGTAGQDIFLDIQLVQDGFSHWFLKDPSGGTIVSYGFNSGSGNPSENDGVISLTASGTYTLEVTSLTDQTPAYQFAIYDVPAADVTAAELDTTYTGQIDAPGQTDEWLFDLTAGQTVRMDVLSAGPGLARMILLAPDGSWVYGANNGGSGPLSITETGRYTFLVDGLRDDTPVYEFALRDISPVIRSTQIGSAESATISGQNISDIWQFDAVAGQEIYLQWTNLEGSLSYQVLDPDSAVAFSGLGNTAGTLQNGAVLAATGTWQIVVDGLGGTPTYGFRLWDVPPPDVVSIAAGQLGLGVIESPGRRDQFEFSGVAGQQIFIDFQDSQGWVEWQLLDPDGNSLQSRSAFLLSQLDGAAVQFPVDGTYTLSANARSDTTATYEFRIFDVTATAPATISFDQIVSGSLNQPGQELAYTFAATSGQSLQVDVLLNQDDGLGWNLAAPSGQILRGNERFDHTFSSLPETGTYRLTFDQHTSVAADTTGHFSFRIVDPAVTKPLPDPADLVVTQVLRPAVVVGNPAVLEVSWTVENQGPAAADLSGWTDRIYLSKNTTFERAQDSIAGQYSYSGMLAAGASYSRTEQLTLPDGFDGDLTVIVETDAENQVYEFQQESNNLLVQSPTAVYRRELETGPASIQLNVDDGDQFPVDSTVALSGIATVLPATANLIFAIDLSASTLAAAGSDANFDGIADAADDLNNDGSVGDILDVEIGSLLRIVQNLRDNHVDARVAVVPFATFVDTADLSPLYFNQSFHSPLADDDQNGQYDLDEAVLTMTAGNVQKFRELGLSTGTNFEATVTRIDGLLARAITAQKTQVFFLTDGSAPTPTPAALEQLGSRGIEFHGFQITGSEVTSPLQTIADTIDADPSSTGKARLVADPQDLASSLLRSLQIAGVRVQGRGVQSLDAAGNFFTPIVIQAGANPVTVEVIDSDGNPASRTITLIGITKEAVPAVSDLQEITAAADVQWSRSTFNRLTQTLHATVTVTNTSADILDPPLLGVLERLSPAAVTVATADGQLTDSGQPYLDFSSSLPATGLAPGQATAARQVGFHNPDLQRFEFDVSLLARGNTAPFFTTVPLTEARIGTLYTDKAFAEDAEDHSLTWRLVRGPQDLTLDPDTGFINWLTTAADSGQHDLEYQVLDGHGGRATRTLQLFVRDDAANRPPVFTTSPLTFISSGSSYQYAADAFDIDGDSVSFSFASAPVDADIDPDSGLVTLNNPADGTYVFAVKAEDGHGGEAVQQFTLSVGTPSGNGHAPAIRSTPPTVAVVDEAYLYLPLAQDPDRDLLSWELVAAPAGMTCDPQTGQIDWIPTETQFGSATVILEVDDGSGGIARQFFTIEVFTVAPNRAPVFRSVPVSFATAQAAWQYPVLASDPEGAEVTYELLSGPAGMSLAPAAGPASTGLPSAQVLTWTPTSTDPESTTVKLRATDPEGAAAVQTFVLQVRGPNTAPQITTSPRLTVTADTVYRYDVDAVDPDDAVHFAVSGAPDGMTINRLTGQIQWAPVTADIGSYPLTVTATDDRNLTTQQSFVLTVTADTQAPEVALQFSHQTLSPGQTVTVQVLATDDVSVSSLSLVIDGTDVVLDASGQAAFTASQSGLPVITATATDRSGNVGTASEFVTVIDPADQTPPVILVSSPEPAEVVTYLTDIVGSITDENLVGYEVAWSPVFAEQWTTFASRQFAGADGHLSDEILATFDPTLLTNNTYDVRITATDVSGNSAEHRLMLNVAGAARVGNAHFAATDLMIPVAGGPPITVSRRYDTLLADVSGDFGYGWEFCMAEPNLVESVPRSPYEDLLGQFAAFPFQEGDRVYLTTPDCQRVGFTFLPQPHAGIWGLVEPDIYDPVWVPDPGVGYQLYGESDYLTEAGAFSLTDGLPLPLKRLNDGLFVMARLGAAYNPLGYHLVSPDQTRYHYDQQQGLTGVVDRHGNSLQFDDQGITSSSGQQVQFRRDELGRITAVIDPAGTEIHYQYNSAGELIQVTYPNGQNDQYAYDAGPEHYLSAINSDNSQQAVSDTIHLEYNLAGRLTEIVDGLEQQTTRDYDLLNRIERITDPLGNVTQLQYDERGNLTSETGPLGDVVQISYDAGNRETSITDPRGHVTQFAYDDHGRLTSVTDPLGATTVATWDEFGRVSSQTDALGHQYTFTYDTVGNLVQIQAPLGATTTLTYDGLGRTRTVTDANGRILTLEYDGTSLPSRVIHPDGMFQELDYNVFGQITRLVDENGNATDFEFDARGRMLSVTDALGHVTTFSYDGRNPDTITNSRGETTEFLFDYRGLVTRVTDPAGGVRRFTYDANGDKLTETDPAGRTTHYAYDGLRRLKTVTDAAGNKTAFEYDAAGNQTAVIDALGRRTESVYDARNYLITHRDPLQHEWTYTYDAVGNNKSVTDARGYVTAFDYDPLQRLAAVTDAVGGRTTYEYDLVGNLVKLTNPLGQTTLTEYDSRNRRTQITDAVGGIQTLTYDAAGNRLSVTDQLGRTTDYAYDALHRTTALTDPSGAVWSMDYDETGQPVAVTDPLGFVSRYAYDSLNRLQSITDEAGGVTEFVYDAVGNRTQLTDAVGNITNYTYDDLNRLLSVIDARAAETAYRYDAVGNLLSVTDPLGQQTQFEYDSADRLIERVDPLGNRSFLEYDAVGNLVRTVDRIGRERTIGLDALNRRTSEVWSDDTGIRNQLAFVYDAVGNLLAASDDFSQYSFSYDDLNRTAGVSNDGTPGPLLELTYSYDAVGNLLETSDQSGVTVTAAYDDRDLLTNLVWSGGPIDPVSISFAWNQRRELSSLQRYSDAAKQNLISQSSYAYDQRGLLSRITHADAADVAMVDYVLSRDEVGQLLEFSHHGDTFRFSHDSTGQLLSTADQADLDEYFSYDANGNRLNNSAVIGPGNQLLADADYEYEYDAEGNLVRQTAVSNGEYIQYSWDHRNRLTQAVTYSAGGIILQEISYQYDVLDRRIARTADLDGAGPDPAATVYTVYNGQHAWADFDAVGTEVARYLFGQRTDQILARWQPATGTAWYLADHLGTVRDLLDASGQLAQTIDYDSFGRIISRTNPEFGDRFTFTGREWDPDLKLYYYRARFYDPAAGRFISQDPLGFAAGDANLYRYVGNAVLTTTDPSGQAALVEYLALASLETALGLGCAYGELWARDALDDPWARAEAISSALLQQAFRAGLTSGLALTITSRGLFVKTVGAALSAVSGAMSTYGLVDAYNTAYTLPRNQDGSPDLRLFWVRAACEGVNLSVVPIAAGVTRLFRGTGIGRALLGGLDRYPGNVIRSLRDLGQLGLSANRIRQGTNGKLAIIGRGMHSIRALRDNLRSQGIEAEIFDSQISPQMLEEFAEARELGLEELMHTQLFTANRQWAQKLIDEGYSVIDIGGPATEFAGDGWSAFYWMETSFLF